MQARSLISSFNFENDNSFSFLTMQNYLQVSSQEPQDETVSEFSILPDDVDYDNNDNIQHSNREHAMEQQKPRMPASELMSSMTSTRSTVAQKRRDYYKELHNQNMPYPELMYAPQRIPGYLNGSGHAYFGYTMRDLANRVMSRTITQSNILVVSEDAENVADWLKRETTLVHWKEDELQRQINNTIGGSMLIHAKSQQHTYFGLYDGIDAERGNKNQGDVDDWWNNMGADRPGWILMMLVDSLRSDEILNTSQTLLQKATVTYIVCSFGSDTKFQQGFGFDAIQVLLHHNYKVQLLSISHAPDTLVRPNAQITKDGIDFFKSEVRKIAKTYQQPVRGYVFATQGLDLAIPLASEYLESVTKHKIDYKQCPPSLTSIDFVDNNNQHGVRVGCQASSSFVVTDEQVDDKVLGDGSTFWYSGPTLGESEAACIKLNSCKLSISESQTLFSARKDFFPPEVATAKVACRTRILPKIKGSSFNEKMKLKPDQSSPNLLLILIDPISRARFEGSLAKTHALLQRLNFTSFDAYTAVGNNSGPNQAALYSGRPLAKRDSISNHTREWLWDTLRQRGYATLKAEDGCIDNSNMIQSISPKVDHGEAFNKMMCFDFQRPNCLAGKPAAQHLVEYVNEFMIAYNNRKPWAGLIHLIDSHEDTQIVEGTLDDILVEFLFNIYDREQAKKLGSRRAFELQISPDIWNNTVVLVMSDHGLHYGDYVQSAAGLRERSQPMLHVHLPIGLTSAKEREILELNKHFVVTPFDVYRTLLDMLSPPIINKEQKGEREQSLGFSLLRPFPEDRKSCALVPEIPKQVCELFKRANTNETNRFTIPNPPSASSFYADIHVNNKPVIESLGNQKNSADLFKVIDEECICATNVRSWDTCTRHPWSSEGISTNNISAETFNMVSCGDSLVVDIMVQPDPNILNRPEVKNAQASGLSRHRPNVLWIAVNSVSTAYADRHFPRTRELLKKYRLRSPQSRSGGTSALSPYECNSKDWCSAELSHFSLVGANQISASSGCRVTNGIENCENDRNPGVLCTDPSKEVYGMELVHRFRIAQTWCNTNAINSRLFDIAKASGYVTLFAEEFCYGKSPLVAQRNMTEVDADILPHHIFCREVERKMLKDKRMTDDQVWLYEETKDPSQLGIDGPDSFPKANVSLNHIRSMIDAYREIPKFAYAKALAAHVHQNYSTIKATADAYDSVLSAFLTEILNHEAINNTIILVTSDHGLQGGIRTVDYATQMEALRPWMEVIVTTDFPGSSLHYLYQNQNRLVSAADLYKTLTTAVATGKTGVLPLPLNGTFDFFNEEIPESRTCSDAKIPADYCLYENERTSSAPNLGTCNLADDDQEFLCPSLKKKFERDLAADVIAAFVSKDIEADSCSNESWSNFTVRDSIKELWGMIDKEVATHPKVRVSGGIFLYPRQTSLLIALVTFLAKQTQEIKGRHLTVCETGFGAGHSAAMFLAASPNVSLHSFDKFDRPYQIEVISRLESTYPGRIKHYAGDSCKTVPSNLSPIIHARSGPVPCDVLHASSLCKTDSIDLVENSPCGVLLTATAMNSLTDNVVYFGPDGQWTKLREKKCIRDITCFGEEARVLEKNYVFNKNGATISHKFCIAITTGSCQRNQNQIGLQKAACERTIAGLTNLHLQLSQICQAHQLPVPE